MEYMQIHLLMNGHTPIGAYQDKALADADCWTCNEGINYTSEYIPETGTDYWVKTIPLVVDDLVIV